MKLLFCIDTTRIWNDPFNGMIRLMEGDYINEGRLEVYCNGQWGTVCDANYAAAGTACQQLGYEMGPVTSYYFSSGD